MAITYDECGEVVSNITVRPKRRTILERLERRRLKRRQRRSRSTEDMALAVRPDLPTESPLERVDRNFGTPYSKIC